MTTEGRDNDTMTSPGERALWVSLFELLERGAARVAAHQAAREARDKALTTTEAAGSPSTEIPTAS